MAARRRRRADAEGLVHVLACEHGVRRLPSCEDDHTASESCTIVTWVQPLGYTDVFSKAWLAKSPSKAMTDLPRVWRRGRLYQFVCIAVAGIEVAPEDMYILLNLIQHAFYHVYHSSRWGRLWPGLVRCRDCSDDGSRLVRNYPPDAFDHRHAFEDWSVLPISVTVGATVQYCKVFL